jgi:hypothetical protein
MEHLVVILDTCRPTALTNGIEAVMAIAASARGISIPLVRHSRKGTPIQTDTRGTVGIAVPAPPRATFDAKVRPSPIRAISRYRYGVGVSPSAGVSKPMFTCNEGNHLVKRYRMSLPIHFGGEPYLLTPGPCSARPVFVIRSAKRAS